MKFYFFEIFLTNVSKNSNFAAGYIIGAVSRLNAYNIIRRRFGKRMSGLISLYLVPSVEKLQGANQYIILAQKTPPRGAIVERRR